MLAVVELFREEALQELPAVPKVGGLRAKTESFFAELAPFLEDYSRVRWAVLTASEVVPDVERGVVLRALRERVYELLASEKIDASRDASIAAALRAAVDPMTWLLYRVHQRLSIAESRKAMTCAVLALARECQR